jgi:hypothetical protein
MKKTQGTLVNSITHLVLSILLVFICVAALLPAHILAQNNQSNSIPAKAAQKESSIPSTSSLVSASFSLEPSPSPASTPTPESGMI